MFSPETRPEEAIATNGNYDATNVGNFVSTCCADVDELTLVAALIGE